MVCAGKWRVAKGSRKYGFLKVLTSKIPSPPPQPVFGERSFWFFARDKRVGKVVFSFSYLTLKSLTEKKEVE